MSLFLQVERGHAAGIRRVTSKSLFRPQNSIFNKLRVTSAHPTVHAFRHRLSFLVNRDLPVYFIPSYTARASRNFFSTNSFSPGEFQSGYCAVTSIVWSIHALKYSASSRAYARFPPTVT